MLMASSSSSSSIAPRVQYDVFLSFRGEDTRNNFTSHLYAALCGKKIDTFIDDELKRGDQISPALLNAMEQSKISVVIFSEGYASSRSCLEELAKILECKSSYGQVVIPVFYQVDPSNVRHQTEAFGNGFAKVEERFNGEPEKLQKWRDALRAAANLSGFPYVTGPEAELVKNIVEEVLKRLKNESTKIDNKNLVGIASRIKHIEELLCDNRKIGIWGSGGIGKTTLARAVFEKVSKDFEGFYFIPDIREESEKSKRLTELRQKLFSKILHDKDVDLESNFTTTRLGRTKVFIVFDDVTCLDQIESLIGDLDYLSLESRIIITTRDKHVLENYKVDYIYETEALSDEAALQLFSQYAFKADNPREDFMQPSSKVLTFVQGIPLALKVFGSFLLNRPKQDWESTIDRFKQSPPAKIQEVLRVSYDGLENQDKDIFLDIAFFFKGCQRDFIEEILDACGFKTHFGISTLIEKSLIFESFGTITMHDLLQQMGREIVWQESPNDPGKRSRLWSHKDICSVLTRNTGTSAIRGIRLHMSKEEEIHLKPTAFSEMHNLKFLQVHGSISEYDSISKDENKVHGFEFVKFDFSELRHFFWFGYPGKSLPPNFHPKSLVALDMPFSKLQQLSLGDQDLVNLKHINLRNSTNLLKILGLFQTPNLKSLILAGCTSLNRKGCLNFNHLPYSVHWKFLRKLNFSKCFSLKKVPSIPCSVEELNLDGTKIKELLSIEHPSRLVTLSLEDCSRLERLSNDISELRSLQNLRLSGCSKLVMIPKISSKMIKHLDLQGTAIKELPSLEYPFQLNQLDLKNCSRLESLPKDFYRLKSLFYLDLSGCLKLDKLRDSLRDLGALCYLKASRFAIREVLSSIICLNKLLELKLVDCCISELPNNIGQLHRLWSLNLSGNNFESLPTSIKDLSKLYELDLSNCKRLQSLPKLPRNLRQIYAAGCSSLEALSGLPSTSMTADWIDFQNCSKLDFSALPEMTDVIEGMQQKADIWFRARYEPYMFLRRGEICFPGSEVPGWFSYKSIGSFIEFPAGWLHDNIVGVVVCVVQSPLNDPKSGFLGVKYDLFINGLLLPRSICRVYCGFEKLESDHVILGYDSYIMRTNKLHTFSSNSEGSIQFYVEDMKRMFKDYSRVKKCGVRFFYAKDYLRTDADREAGDIVTFDPTVFCPSDKEIEGMCEN